MPASLYQSNFNMERISNYEDPSSAATVKLALELASMSSNFLGFDNDLHLGGGSNSDPLSLGSGPTLAQLDEKARKSQNMTECVPVPTSEHVAEIVGRQGCKIKALRAKTNTYIKTPVRGEEPVFVVTGRKEDVAEAKHEILGAADHFSQIRANRNKSNLNSTLAFGQLVANTPGQTTISVRVPYRVVGLVVGPKGATIKRIQQQTHTYIVTPSRDKEPVFEVTGLPENVEQARKEIEAHIALRTGSGPFDCLDSGLDGDISPSGWPSNPGPVGSGMMESTNSNGKLLNDFNTNSILSSGLGPRDQFSSSNTGSERWRNLSNNVHELSRLHSLLDGNINYDSKFDAPNDSSIGSLWRCSDSHDSGIGHSPPFDSGSQGLHNGGIWNELAKGLSGIESPSERRSPLAAAITKPGQDTRSSMLDLTPRSASIDLGIPGGMVVNTQQNGVVDSQTNSLPFTLNGLINASLSSSMSTLSVTPSEQSSSGARGLLDGLTRHHSRSPADHTVGIESVFVSSPADSLWS